MEIFDLIRKYESKPLTLPALPTGYIEVINSDEKWTSTDQHSQQNCTLPFARSNCYTVPIKACRLLMNRSQDVKEVHEIAFDIEGIDDFHFNPGDTIGILPINSDNEVSSVLKTISLCDSGDQKIVIQLVAGSKKKLPNYLPQQTSAKKCLRECLDLHSIPKKLFLRCLMEYLDDREKRFVEILCSKEGAAEYSERIVNARTTFLIILKSFRSWSRIPFQLLLEHLPRLLPRPYSVANSPLRDPNILKIWFSLDEPPGVTTKMLKEIIAEAKDNTNPLVPIYLRQSNLFSYTENEIKDPVVLIAAGVGVSPFLGFLEHRREKLNEGMQLTNAILFFGCRHEKESLGKDILLQHLRAGSLTDLKEAFSRDITSELKYVQDQIKLNGALVMDELKANCRIYVCGSRDMVQDVRKSIQNCLTDSTAYSNEEAIDFVRKLVKDKRYIEDTWM